MSAPAPTHRSPQSQTVTYGDGDQAPRTRGLGERADPLASGAGTRRWELGVRGGGGRTSSGLSRPFGSSRSGGRVRVSSRTMDDGKATTTDNLKRSLYFPEEMLREIASEARRLNRSKSWVVQRAWKVAREEIKKMPSTGA
jgi:uncharacterized small protein (TIGR04563 family)